MNGPRKQRGYIGPAGKRFIGGQNGNAALDNFIRSLGPAAWFRRGDWTVTGSGISQWNDSSGNGRHLLQGTDANRPISLLHSVENYLYLPGVAGNYASTPDSAANSAAGTIEAVFRLSTSDWTPSSAISWVGKIQTNTTRSWYVQLATTTVTIYSSPDGTGPSQVNGAINAGSTLFADGATGWVRIRFVPNDGAGNRVYELFTAADQTSEPTAWTQRGSTVTTAGATSVHDNSSQIEIGGLLAGTAQLWPGSIYRGIVRINGTTVVDFNAADATNEAASFASSTTGETWTVNSTGAKPAQIVGMSSALFDGSAHFLKCSAFTLNQPTWVVMALKQVGWTDIDYLFDGDASSSGAVRQRTSSPGLCLHAGSDAAQNAGPAIGAVAVVSAVFNGASSALGVNNLAASTGNPGAGNMGGFTLAAIGSGSARHSNIQVYEVALFPIAPSAAQQDRVIRYMAGVAGVSL